MAPPAIICTVALANGLAGEGRRFISTVPIAQAMLAIVSAIGPRRSARRICAALVPTSSTEPTNAITRPTPTRIVIRPVPPGTSASKTAVQIPTATTKMLVVPEGMNCSAQTTRPLPNRKNSTPQAAT